MHVEFRDIDDEPVGSARLVRGQVTFARALQWIAEAYVVDPDAGRPVTPEDGEAYLRALPLNFRGAYFRAVLVRYKSATSE